jgi:F-type H+-transporting ATPase subunit epsilon
VAKTLRCSIVTPTQTVLDEEVTYASIPAWDGQLGVMTGQSPLLTQLGVGSLRLSLPSGGDRWFLVEGGFAQIQDNQLNLLTENAVPVETLSLRDAEAELAEANARIARPGADAAKVKRDQDRALAKLTLAKARGGR